MPFFWHLECWAVMEDRKGKWSPEAGGAEAVKIYLALPCYINMRISRMNVVIKMRMLIIVAMVANDGSCDVHSTILTSPQEMLDKTLFVNACSLYPAGQFTAPLNQQTNVDSYYYESINRLHHNKILQVSRQSLCNSDI